MRSLAIAAVVGAVISFVAQFAVVYPKLRDARRQAVAAEERTREVEASLRGMEDEALAARQALQSARQDASVVRAVEARHGALERVQKEVEHEAASSSLAEYLNARR